MQIDLINCAEVEAASQIMLFDRGVRVPEAQYKESFRRIHDNLTRALRVLRTGTGGVDTPNLVDSVYLNYFLYHTILFLMA
jgi:hypothetical protein